MKKKLLIVCLTMLTLVAKTQNSGKELINSKIQEFKNHLYLSTSKDPLAILKSRTIKTNELEANDLVYRTTNDVRLKSGDLQGASIDTTHTYPWNPETQDWDTVPTTRIIKSYDEQRNLVHYIDYLWDGESWSENVQFFYKYNEANQQINVIQQAWQFDGYESYGWRNVDQVVCEYNELAQKTRYTYQYWDYEINNWENSWKQEFSYDANGNNDLIVESYWDGGLYDWTAGLNISNEFDENGNVILNPIQYWDSNANDWTNAYQYIYEYNSFNENKSMLIQVWNVEIGEWENYMLKMLYYNDNNKIDSYLFQMWDSFLYRWSDSQRAKYKYDDSGNNICILGESYDNENNTWNTSWINYFDYNEQNRQISSSSLYYDSGLANWYVGSKTKNAKISIIKQKTVDPLPETLEVFPNPASEWVNIENDNQINQIELFNSLGSRMLVRSNIESNSIKLDIAELNAGVYFLSIKDVSGITETKKFVKN